MFVFTNQIAFFAWQLLQNDAKIRFTFLEIYVRSPFRENGTSRGGGRSDGEKGRRKWYRINRQSVPNMCIICFNWKSFLFSLENIKEAKQSEWKKYMYRSSYWVHCTQADYISTGKTTTGWKKKKKMKKWDWTDKRNKHEELLYFSNDVDSGNARVREYIARWTVNSSLIKFRWGFIRPPRDPTHMFDCCGALFPNTCCRVACSQHYRWFKIDQNYCLCE